MAMHKTGQSQVPMGKSNVPWPSKTLVFKSEEGGFVPQPIVTNEACSAPSCQGTMLVVPDKGGKVCQKCGAKPTAGENSR